MAKAKLTKRLHIRVTSPFKQAVLKAADQLGMSEPELVRKAVEKMLAESEKQKAAA